MKRPCTALLCVILFASPFHVRASSEDSHMSPLGVSAEFIQDFMKYLEDETLDERDVNERYIKPATHEKNCPFANLFEGEVGPDGRPWVGPSTIFVKHSPKYPMLKTLQAVLKHSKETGDQHYYRINLFTVNQHDIRDQGSRDAIAGVEATLLIFSPAVRIKSSDCVKIIFDPPHLQVTFQIPGGALGLF